MIIPDYPAEFVEGRMLLLDKPLFITSFFLVSRLRRIISAFAGVKRIKIGHAGTLDPLASGLMIVCTGKATKQISLYQNLDKEYYATIFLGAVSDSYDMETPLRFNTIHGMIEYEEVKAAIGQLTGELIQQPPVYSAIRLNGKHAYEAARKGQIVEMGKRQITIYSAAIKTYNYPVLEVIINCSTGTYIRSWTSKLGEILGTGAVLIGLRRTKTGTYDISDAISLQEIEKKLAIGGGMGVYLHSKKMQDS